MRSRRKVVVATLVVCALALFGLSSVLAPAEDDPTSTPSIEWTTQIQPVDNGSQLWPYTSRKTAVDGRTLAINLVVYGSDENVRRALTDYDPVPEERRDANASTNASGVTFEGGLGWQSAHGAVRYTYVDPGADGTSGQWLTESYQLESGTYLGSRIHVRAYASPTEDWTALQAHTDYWDWFRLRHTVPDTQRAATTIESDLQDKPFVEEVSRTHYGFSGGRSDGWLSVIRLAGDSGGGQGPTVLFVAMSLLGVVAAVGTETRNAVARAVSAVQEEVVRQRDAIFLAAVLVAIVVGVRVGGIGLETAFPQTNPKLFAALLYPVLAVGIPVVTAKLSTECDPYAAYAVAALGLATGLVLDFAIIGVTSVPMKLVFHRIGLLVALGLIASGSAMTDATGRRLFVVGIVTWFVGLWMPLFNVL